MSKRNKHEFEDKVGSWSERIGASIIGLLTILGVGLIIYTGFKAATYEAPKSDQEYLTLEDTDVTTEDKPVTEETTPETDAAQTEAPVEPSTDETQKPATDETTENQPVVEEPSTETPQTMEAICNIDGVNVREEPQTGTTIIGQLISGEKITVLNRNYSDEWVQVSYDGQTGYVYFEYLDFE